MSKRIDNESGKACSWMRCEEEERRRWKMVVVVGGGDEVWSKLEVQDARHQQPVAQQPLA